MVEVKSGYVHDGRWFADISEAQRYEYRRELEVAASCKMGYSVPKLIEYLFANFILTRIQK